MKFLLQHNANPNLSVIGGSTPLCFANVECTKLLLQYRANVNPGDPAPLEYASMNGHVTKVRLLLDYGANPNYVNQDGSPIFFFAINNDVSNSSRLERMEIVRLFLQHGALVSKREGVDYNALDIARWCNNSYVVPLLRAALKKEQAAKLRN